MQRKTLTDEDLRRDIERLCALMKYHFSIDPLDESHCTDNVSARAMICSVLIEKGYKKIRIGTTLGWTFGSVRYYQNVVMKRIVRGERYEDQDLRSIWKRFQPMAKQIVNQNP